jgi:hypothetical protein
VLDVAALFGVEPVEDGDEAAGSSGDGNAPTGSGDESAAGSVTDEGSAPTGSVTDEDSAPAGSVTDEDSAAAGFVSDEGSADDSETHTAPTGS